MWSSLIEWKMSAIPEWIPKSRQVPWPQLVKLLLLLLLPWSDYSGRAVSYNVVVEVLFTDSAHSLHSPRLGLSFGRSLFHWRCRRRCLRPHLYDLFARSVAGLGRLGGEARQLGLIMDAFNMSEPGMKRSRKASKNCVKRSLDVGQGER